MSYASFDFLPGDQCAASRRGLTFCPGLRNGPAERTTASLPLIPLPIVTPLSPTEPILMSRRSTWFLSLTM